MEQDRKRREWKYDTMQLRREIKILDEKKVNKLSYRRRKEQKEHKDEIRTLQGNIRTQFPC